MGKQGRRKQREKRKQQGNDTPSSQPSVNPSSAVHQLRHADPKIRQTALITVQAHLTLQHHQDSSSNKVISVAVLQAIREQVMDANFECASAAAECLAAYLSYTPNLEHQAITTASWIPVFLVRLDQCLKAIQNDTKKWKPWYAVAAPCMKALCRLVESNERALEQIMSSTTQMDSFLTTIMGILLMTTQFERTPDTRFNEWVEEAAIYGARTLHSSLDDNGALAERINLSTQSTATDTWTSLLTKLPNLSSLHICGSLVMMHQMVPQAWHSPLLVQQVLPCVCRQLLLVQPDQLRSIEQAFSEAIALRKSQKIDQEMEEEIVRKIQDRKEPAHLIARRQKDVDRGSKASIEETKDGDQAIDEAISTWSGVILPLQLTLEVIANLLSTFIRGADEMDQDDAPVDSATLGALISARLGESLVKVMQVLCSYLDCRGTVPKEHETLTDDLTECISKMSACITNAILSKVLEPNSFEATWQVLHPHMNSSVGVSSVFVALARQGFPVPVQDTAGIHQLLLSSNDDSQRDGVALLAVMMNNPHHAPLFVVNATHELLRVLNQGSTPAKLEALNAIMDLWGQDDYHPEIFANQKILPSFQGSLASLSTNKNLDPEGEEILFNASRFVDYKLGM